MSKTTKIAIPEWQGHVSTVFDFASNLLLIETAGDKETGRTESSIPDGPMPQRVTTLKSLGVDVLICGAISQPLAYMITGLGIELLLYVSGPIDEVLNAYLTGRLTEQRFSMPGCKTEARKGFRGRGRWQGQSQGRVQGRGQGRGRGRCRKGW